MPPSTRWPAHTASRSAFRSVSDSGNVTKPPGGWGLLRRSAEDRRQESDPADSLDDLGKLHGVQRPSHPQGAERVTDQRNIAVGRLRRAIASSITCRTSRTQTSVRPKRTALVCGRRCPPSGFVRISDPCWSSWNTGLGGAVASLRIRARSVMGPQARVGGIIQAGLECGRSAVAEQARCKRVDSRPRQRFLHAQRAPAGAGYRRSNATGPVTVATPDPFAVDDMGFVNSDARCGGTQRPSQSAGHRRHSW